MTIHEVMDGLVTTQVLEDFQAAAKALFRDLAYGEDEFDIPDIRNFILLHADAAGVQALEAGPLKVEDYPKLTEAIAYVKRYVTNGAKVSGAIAWAKGLYDLDAEAVRLLRKEIDKAWTL